MAKWLKRIEETGWTRYLSEPRYALISLAALAAAGRARHRRASIDNNAPLLNFLFPPAPSRTRAHQHARVDRTRLPDDLFPTILRYYWGGQLE